jgi:hypothetical protein
MKTTKTFGVGPYRSTVIPPLPSKRVWQYSAVQVVLGLLAVATVLGAVYLLFVGIIAGLFQWGHYAAIHFDHRTDHLEYAEYVGNGVRWIVMPVVLVIGAIFIPMWAYQFLKFIGSLIGEQITKRAKL